MARVSSKSSLEIATTVLVGLLLFSSGCAGKPLPSAVKETAAATEAGNPWNNQTQMKLLDVGTGGGFEFDVKCLMGGGVSIAREDGAFVANGTDHLEARVSADATFTGLQIGYTFDGNDAYDEKSSQVPIHWFSPVSGGSKTFQVPVTKEQWEDNDTIRWRFFERMNLPAAEQDCYTGGGLGSWQALVDAVRGPH